MGMTAAARLRCPARCPEAVAKCAAIHREHPDAAPAGAGRICRVSLRPPQVIAGCDYVKCSGCGEVVMTRKAVPGKKGLLCQVCAAKIL